MVGVKALQGAGDSLNFVPKLLNLLGFDASVGYFSRLPTLLGCKGEGILSAVDVFG